MILTDTKGFFVTVLSEDVILDVLFILSMGHQPLRSGAKLMTTKFWSSTGGIILICHVILALIAAIVAIFAVALAKTLNDMTILGPSIMALVFV